MHSYGGLPSVRGETCAFGYELIASVLIERIKTVFILLEKQESSASASLSLH